MQGSILCWSVSGAFFIASLIAGYIKNKAIASISTTPTQKEGNTIMDKTNNKAITVTTIAEAVQNACNTASGIAASTGVPLLS
ncbi:hypothetical protein [Rahnella victoriana]|uniref:hypothetical protein n=1 Tax=Rahnella victoriana TaxID=1510570 RepID=UPI000F4F62DF|nr:hypothetical protein [Rahnella victoriana]